MEGRSRQSCRTGQRAQQCRLFSKLTTVTVIMQLALIRNSITLRTHILVDENVVYLSVLHYLRVTKRE